MRLEPLSDLDGLGRLVQGVSVSQGVRDDEIAELSRLLFEHGALLLRDQDITPAGHVEFARRFGELDSYPHELEVPGLPEIFSSSNVPGRGRPGYAAYWHLDGVNFPRLPVIALYHMVDVPPYQAETLFLNAERALANMPDSLRVGLPNLSIEVVDGIAHRMLRAHPVTGRTVPCIRTMLPRGIVELSRAASRAFLGELERFLDAQPGVYRHAWRPGDLLLTDNASVLHKAVRPRSNEPRTIHRVTVKQLAG